MPNPLSKEILFRATRALIVCLVLVTVMPCMIFRVHAESPPSREYVVKAAFLYNFAKFVKWPEATFPVTDKTISICILGKDPFGPALNTIEDKFLKGKKVVIRHVETLDQDEDCRIVFISNSEHEHFPQILDTLKYSNVLTVGDTDGFTKLGGILNFVLVEGKVRFEINVTAAEQAGLKISSQLLKLADSIIDD